MMNTERCICCGEVIPEGRQICLKCEKKMPAATPSKPLAMALHCRGGGSIIDRPACSECDYYDKYMHRCDVRKICHDVLKLLGV